MMTRLRNLDVALLLVRLAVGVPFVVHGWMKFSNLAGTAAFFGSLGLGAFFAYLVAAVELLGGLAVLLGAFTEIAGLLLAIVMVFAMFLATFSGGFVGYELNLVLFLAALGVAFAGAGRYAVKWGPRAPGGAPVAR